jgi:hypothetical protein
MTKPKPLQLFINKCRRFFSVDDGGIYDDTYGSADVSGGRFIEFFSTHEEALNRALEIAHIDGVITDASFASCFEECMIILPRDFIFKKTCEGPSNQIDC